eukprot:SAG11_NODE_15690_length_569_cov_1.091489_1_plen_88_part_10
MNSDVVLKAHAASDGEEQTASPVPGARPKSGRTDEEAGQPGTPPSMVIAALRFADQLKRFASLRDEGAISDDEFAMVKRDLITNMDVG